jgi:hypothetical protein
MESGITNSCHKCKVNFVTAPKWPTWKDLQKFKGLLKDSPIFEGDAVEIQRKMRDE